MRLCSGCGLAIISAYSPKVEAACEAQGINLPEPKCFTCAAVAAEREECAKIADNLSGDMIDGALSIDAIADAIRARE